jgi:hypothetical protein
MKIGKRWSVKLDEVSAGHYRCRAVDCDGRILECEGSDEMELEERIRVDAYLYDNMVINKLLINSLCGRKALRPLHAFLGGYMALDDTDAGWYSFFGALTALKGMREDLTGEEYTAVDELHESLSSVFPLLIRGATIQTEQVETQQPLSAALFT